MVNSPVAVLELQCLGAQVTLIDRCDPGLEASSGNTGVIARSALMPFTLRKSLPALLRNKPAPAGRSESKPAPARQRVVVPLPQPGRLNLWQSFAHQHVGFSTGTAKLLGALMSGQRAPIDAPPSAPNAFSEPPCTEPRRRRACGPRAALPERPIRESSKNCRSQQLSNKKHASQGGVFLRGEIPLSYPA